ncbi:MULTISPECIES: hypothetical protein [unclassified Methylobacterium]|uniref:hypothetical protein n=1 Tax=unclassified Methylobacterium TaxID=2615210 RepID=UPI002269BEE1|nr:MULTISPECIES: hypothetical protein [unclassified Methylobacterium]
MARRSARPTCSAEWGLCSNSKPWSSFLDGAQGIGKLARTVRAEMATASAVPTPTALKEKPAAK